MADSIQDDRHSANQDLRSPIRILVIDDWPSGNPPAIVTSFLSIANERQLAHRPVIANRVADLSTEEHSDYRDYLFFVHRMKRACNNHHIAVVFNLRDFDEKDRVYESFESCRRGLQWLAYGFWLSRRDRFRGDRKQWDEIVLCERGVKMPSDLPQDAPRINSAEDAWIQVEKYIKSNGGRKYRPSLPLDRIQMVRSLLDVTTDWPVETFFESGYSTLRAPSDLTLITLLLACGTRQLNAFLFVHTSMYRQLAAILDSADPAIREFDKGEYTGMSLMITGLQSHLEALKTELPRIAELCGIQEGWRALLEQYVRKMNILQGERFLSRIIQAFDWCQLVAEDVGQFNGHSSQAEQMRKDFRVWLGSFIDSTEAILGEVRENSLALAEQICEVLQRDFKNFEIKASVDLIQILRTAVENIVNKVQEFAPFNLED